MRGKSIERRDMQRTQRFDFKNTSQKGLKIDTFQDPSSSDEQTEERKEAHSREDSAEMDSNESEMENIERETGQNAQAKADGFYNMVEYSQLDSDADNSKEPESSTFDFRFPSNGKLDQASRVRQIDFEDEVQQDSSANMQLDKLQLKNRSYSHNSQATNESFSSPESQTSPYDQQRQQVQEPRRLNFKHVKKSSVGHSRKPSDGQKRTQNQTETIQSKVALILPFKEEQETEIMEYQCQSSDSQGLEQEEASNQDSLDSDERAEQLRRQDMLEYEIRRLEQLNLEIAQRLKEPQTTDESQDDKEEFNLLEDSASLIQVRPISNLDEEQNQNNQSPGQNNPFFTFEKVENVDNNQDGSDKSPADRSSFQQSVKSRQSRKLYVIEEEQSVMGGQQSTYRSRHSYHRAGKSELSERTYLSHDKNLQRNSDTYGIKNQDGALHELSMGDMTRTQKFDMQMRQSLGSANLAASFKSSMNSPNRNLDNSSPDFKKAVTYERKDNLEDNLLETATYNNHVRNYRVKSESIRKEQTQPNAQGSYERSQDRQNDISKDLIPKYLRETTQTSDIAGKIQRMTPNGPFEMISDEDLMNSNFERISKIMPNPENLLTDEGDRDTPVSGDYPNLDNSSNERKLIMQLLSENTQLKQIIAQKDKQIKVQAKKLAKNLKPDAKEQSTQTNGPRSKAYYESIPAKVDTGIFKRQSSEENNNNSSFALKPFVVDSSKRSSDAEKSKRVNTPTKKRKSFSTSTPKNKKGAKQADFIASPQKLQMMAQTNSQNPNEDARSLRVQLVSLKNQLTSQETDNMHLQEKIAYFESHVARMDKKLSKLDAKLKNKKSQNQELQSSIEELGQRIESLMADNSELRAQLQNQDPSFSLSFQNQKIQIEQQKNFQLNQKIQQMEQEARKHDKRLQKLRRELAQVLADKQDIRKRLDEQFEENQRLVAKQPDLFDFATQTDADHWKEIVQTAARDLVQTTARDQKFSRVSTEPQSPKAQSPKAVSTKTNLDNKSVQVQVTVPSSYPNHQEQMSDAGLGEQGSNAEQEFIKLLINRANDYEIQYQKIEQEINEYKRMMHEVGQQQQATANHFRGGSHASNMSHLVGFQAPTNPNTSQIVESQYTSHANINPLNATPHVRTINSPSIDQRVRYGDQQFAHYKKKARKLERRNQKLQVEKELSARQVSDLQIRIQEISEKYRDMKQKLYLRLQEKSAKLNDLRHQLTQARAMPQILQVPQIIDVDRLKNAQAADIEDRRQRQNGQREGQDRSRRITPNRRNEDEFNQVLIGTMNEDQINELIKVNKYQNTQSLVSERSSELGRFHPNVSGVRGSTFNNDRVATSIFDEPTGEAKQNFYEVKPNHSMVSNTGEIYSIISGLVDQKFAERHQYDQQRAAQAQMMTAYQASQVKSGNFDLKQRRQNLTQDEALVSEIKPKGVRRTEEPVNLVVEQSRNNAYRSLERSQEVSHQKAARQKRERRDKKIDEVPTQQFQRFYDRKSPVKVEFLSKAANSKLTSLSPQRRTNSGRNSANNSAQKRNRSANSQVSKDDVMPCYKSQFPHHPNSQVVHQPKQVVSEMLSYYFQHTSPKVSSKNQSVIDERTRNTIAPSMQMTRNAKTLNSGESNSTALRQGKITQMLLNGHFRNYVEPGQTR